MFDKYDIWDNIKRVGFDRVAEIGVCWVWQKSLGREGYGTLYSNGKLHGAHRVAYQLFRGEIPPGLFVLHRCDNPACVRPRHLFLGTHQDNMDDMAAKGRSTRGRHLNVGSSHGNAVLDETLVRHIKKLCRSGRSQASVEREYGLGRGLVNKIMRGKLWTHVL